MIESLLYILALLGVESMFLLNAARTKRPHRMRGFLIINMLLIALYAPKLIEVGGFVSNVGNVFFATVVLMQAIVITNFGKSEAVKVANMAVRSMMMFMILAFLLGSVPAVVGNEEFSAMAASISSNSLSVIAASFTAFVIGQFFYVNLYDYLIQKDWAHRGMRYLAAMAALQAVDSFIFFGIAFQGFEGMWKVMLVGLAFKVVLGLVYLPLYLYTTNKK